jgi:class 3 adenylate cyclase
MIETQKLEIIDLKGASNDDVTFLGVAFNSLSSSINNLMNIFLKFVNKDIAQKAYKDRHIKLEGSKKNLTILFSDIRGFTFMTETLGIDIIKLLNIHYNNVINEIIKHEGVIGSIIGDALLSVFGSLDDSTVNKSYQAVIAAYEIQDLTSKLRNNMEKIKAEIEKSKGFLTSLEKKVYKAVLIEIGVGIDGGEVFYGNIGSTVRMTNTVIGDNVNYASRLEGLTKYYKIPVICSEYVKEDIEKNVDNHGLKFIEIDRVRVKGKTIGKPVYYPVFINRIDKNFARQIDIFNEGLQMYYQGKWKSACDKFKACKLPLAEVFIDRTSNFKKPDNWNGVWMMEEK